MALFLWLPLIVPLVGAAAAFVPALHLWPRYSGVVASAVVLGSGVALVTVVLDGTVPTSAGGLLRADALAAFVLSVVGAVALTATWGGMTTRGRDDDALYAALVQLFIGAMSLAVLSDNIGVMWVAVEATTIATAFLVGYHRTRRSLEAAWKYVVIGSVGVAIAFLGVVLIYASSLPGGEPTLSWVQLTQGAASLDATLLQVAAALAVLGFATKAGLAPMHSWLPDAHSQAPAPVSGLMSGVLLAVAFSIVLRIQAISDAALGPELMRGMLVVGGLLSLLVAALLLIGQRDYKRMLAYSSIEHMGIMALGAAVGGVLGLAAVLLHILGHGLSKASLFVVSGRLLTAEGTTSIAEVRGLLARRPGVAIPFVAGMVALLGFPPFGLFFSEVAIVVALWAGGLAWVAVGMLLLLLVVFAALTRLTLGMVLGAGDGVGEHEVPVDRSAHGPRTPIVLALAVTAVIGFLAVPMRTLLTDAAGVLMGGS